MCGHAGVHGEWVFSEPGTDKIVLMVQQTRFFHHSVVYSGEQTWRPELEHISTGETAELEQSNKLRGLASLVESYVLGHLSSGHWKVRDVLLRKFQSGDTGQQP